MTTVAIVPALNEEAAIGEVVRSLTGSVDRVIVVDNGSTDGTPSVAEAAGADVVRQSERGYGAAMLAGVAAAPDADVYVFLDGDGSDEGERAAELIARLQQADLVLGVRAGDVEAGSMFWHQRAGNIFMSWLIRRLSGEAIHDLPSFKAIRGDVLRSLELQERRHGWTAELITRAACRDLRIVEVQTGYRRRVGVSKVSGSFKGSALAASRMNAAIVRVWWEELRSRRSAVEVPAQPLP
ncbi:MAG: glycosyltransferase family 2 protein [Dehalococcoidia bacterium]